MKVPEQYRLVKHPILGSTKGAGNNGMFVIPHPKVGNYVINCMASDGMGWDHVSVTVQERSKQPSRCPTWLEMCFVKDLFWDKTEAVIQFHPPESEYVNNHPFCLHLWKPDGEPMRLPLSIMVGYKNLKHKI